MSRRPSIRALLTRKDVPANLESNSGMDQKSPESDRFETSSGGEWTAEDERRIRRRMDFRIVPTVFALYLLCFIDRANVGNARIQGMANDLDLVGFRFNWALTIFYLSYVAVEIPSNIVLKIIGGRFYLPGLVAAFGLVSMCSAFTSTYEGPLICRFFLGIAEGGMMPGIAYYLSCFYRRHELLLRIGLFITGASLAGAFGGLPAAGLSSILRWGSTARPIDTWRNIFFFEGLFTILISSLGMLILPRTPDACRFLTPKDRYIALERINREHKESASESTRPHHIKRAIFNINNIICGLGFFFINVSVQSFSLFLPTILSALSWTALKTQFYTVPPYTIACIWAIFIAWLSDYYKKRGIFCIVGSVLAIIGYCVLVTAQTDAIKYMAVFFAALGAFPLGPAFLAWGLNNAAGPTVRAVSGGCIVALGNCGAILATWTYLTTDAPYYKRGHYINIAYQCVALLLAAVGIVDTKWENRMREQGGRDYRLQGITPEELDILGYRHPEFRYIS